MVRPYPYLSSKGRGERCADYFLVFAAGFAAFFVAFFAAPGAFAAAFASTFFAMGPPLYVDLYMIFFFFQKYARKNDRNARLFHPTIRWKVLDSGARVLPVIAFF